MVTIDVETQEIKKAWWPGQGRMGQKQIFLTIYC